MDFNQLCEKSFCESLMRASSLTAELKKQPAEFSVRLNFLGLTHLHEDEVSFFSPLSVGAEVFVREVCLCLDHHPVVSARSVCLSDNLFWQKILDCGVRSLGSYLFGADMAHLRRSAFYGAYLPSTHHLVNNFSSECCPARRSVFSVEGEGDLLLTECFLPELKRYWG